MNIRYGRWASALHWPSAARRAGVSAQVVWHGVLAGGSDDPVVLPLRLGGSSTQADLDGATDILRSFYQCARVELVHDRLRGNRTEVLLHRHLLPPLVRLPDDAHVAHDAHLVLLPPRNIPLGTTLRGETVHLELFGDNAASSILIGGVPGVGKTLTLRTVLAGLATTCATVVIIDPTGGAEAARWMPRLSACVASPAADESKALLHQLLTLIDRRGRLLGAGLPISLLAPVVLVCDELSELAAAGGQKQQDEARALLRRIVALGRKANVACVLATQRSTATSIDATTRSLMAWRLALAHPDDVHGSEALLGPGRSEAASLLKKDVDVGFLTNGGPPVLLRVYEVGTDRVPYLAGSGRHLSLDELAGLETVSLAELRRDGRERCEGTYLTP